VQRNRSIPSATVIPVLTYPDVRAAVDWLEAAFGFSERVKIGEDHRSQMSAGDGGAVIVGDVRGERVAPRAGEVVQAVMLRVEDVELVSERARANGARTVTGSQDFEYGERQCTLEDPWGHQWTLSQSLRDVAPAEWGGEAVDGGWS